MRKLILIIAALITLIYLFAVEATEEKEQNTNTSVIEGTLNQIENSWYVQTDSLNIKANLGDKDYQSKIALELKEKDRILLKGIYRNNVLEVISANYNNQQYLFRDEKGNPLWKENTVQQSSDNSVNTYRVIPAKCISCKICYNDCPVKAITMDSSNKAVIDSSKCINCGICDKKCPTNAIKKPGEK